MNGVVVSARFHGNGEGILVFRQYCYVIVDE